MEKFEKLMLPVTIILLLTLGWVFFSDSNQTEPESLVEDASQGEGAYETKNGEMGAVMLEITPLSSVEYALTLNTHSVELDFDFTKIVKLTDNLGNTYDALSWSGERGGHHLQGAITFPEITAEAASVTITVTGIENETLSFEWEL